MTKEIKISIVLIIMGEALFLVNKYLLGDKTGNITNFTSGVLVGISLGLKLTALIILIIKIAKKEKATKKIKK